MDQYIKGTTVGQGTFGVVIKATHKEVGQHTVGSHVNQLSTLMSDSYITCVTDWQSCGYQEDLGKAKEGVNVTALREIKLLKELHGPHIVQLLDVFPHKQNLSLVGCL